MAAWTAHRRLWALPGSVLSSAAFGELHISWQYIPRIKVLSGRAREEPFSERLPLERPFSQKACLSNVPFHS